MFQASQQIGLYTLIRKIGEGGFGEVWLAENRNNSPSTTVAIKLPREDQVDLSTIKEEIFNWILSGKHKNILPIIECEVFGNQIAIISEFAPDGSLQDLLRKHGLFSVADAIEITTGILDGLTHLHNRKIIHRDLKPDNVLFQARTPRLTDFGISRAMTVSSRSRNISGTLSYMAPEAFDGKRNIQTDIWSVGVILYQLLTGNLPFPQKEMIELIGALAKQEPATLPDLVAPALQSIVKKSLAKTPFERYQTADEMRKELNDFSINFSQSFSRQPTKPSITEKNTETLPKVNDFESEATKTGINFNFPVEYDQQVAKTEKVETELHIPGLISPKPNRKKNKLYFVVPLIVVLLLATIGGIYLLSPGFKSASLENAYEKGIAATVNGKTIKLEEIERSIKQQAGEQWSKLSPLELAQARLQVLQNLIQTEVMYQKAEAEKTLPSDDEITTAFNKLKTESGKSAEEFQKEMEKVGETNVTIRESLKKQLAINKLLEKISGKIKPPKDSEIEAFYKGNPEAFVKKKGVKLSAIVIDPKKNSETDKTVDEASSTLVIKEIGTKLNQGADFATLAREKSEDQSAQNGGDLGYLSEEQLKQSYPQLAKLLINPEFEVEKIAGPFNLEGKFYIFKLIERNSNDEILTFESLGVRQQITDALTKGRKDTLSQAYVAQAMNEAEIVNYLLEKTIDTYTGVSKRKS